MRRLIVGAALAGFVLAGAAACGAEKADDTAGGTPTTPSTSTSATAGPTGDVAANTKEVCASAEASLTAAVTKFTTEVPGQIAAASAGGADVKAAAVTAVKKAFTDWATLLRTEANKAADPGLKTAFTDTAAQFDTAAAGINDFKDVEKIEDILGNPALEEAGKNIEKYCGP